MNRIPAALVALALSHLALITGLFLTYNQLPEPVASHFNAAGVPDGWMSRSNHVWAIGGVAIGVTALLLGVFYCPRFFPPSAVNLPRRDYWLAAERREETFGLLFGAGVWLAALGTLFMLGLHLLVVAANASQPARLSSGVWLLGGSLVAIVGAWIHALSRRFNQVA